MRGRAKNNKERKDEPSHSHGASQVKKSDGKITGGIVAVKFNHLLAISTGKNSALYVISYEYVAQGHEFFLIIRGIRLFG